jgi:uncharacterized protein YllA (UPF0747 family)
VAGPGEIAYFAQLGVVAEALALPLPLAVPRTSVRVVTAAVAGTLARHQLDADALRAPHAAAGMLARARTPDAALDAVATMRAALRTAAAQLASSGSALEPHVIDGTSSQLAHRIDRLERRLFAATKRTLNGELAQLEAARAQLWPLGGPQERAASFLPWLVRHGPAFLQALRAACDEAMHAQVHG